MKQAKTSRRMQSDLPTEEKIKVAARKIFMEKGYAGTRTRDIAEEAGINLALLNYYFRSKERLFDMIMLEKLLDFIEGIKDILDDRTTSFDEKIEAVVGRYIDMLLEQPDLPLFVLHELRMNPNRIALKIDQKRFITRSYFMQQVSEAIAQGKIADVNPLQVLMNIVGLTIFPFIASPIIQSIGGLKQQEFNSLMEERKKLIPKWLKSTMQKK